MGKSGLSPGIAKLCPNVPDAENARDCDPHGSVSAIFMTELITSFIFISVIMIAKYGVNSS